MPSPTDSTADRPQPWHRSLLFVAAAAALAGVLVRFKGLSFAPFTVDEYYLSQSIGTILRHGIPAFDCGGYYTRGLLIQYLSAVLQLAGLSAEVAPRTIAVLSSVAALPLTYFLGRRLHGPLVGGLAVIILSLSVWEIEMGRFGRMYAPFQAVFLAYTIFFLRYTVARDSKALWPMLAVSILAPFVWEGGALLLLANLLPVFLQRGPDPIRRGDWTYLAGCTLLLGVMYWFVTYDFRALGDEPRFPSGYEPSISGVAPDPISVLPAPISQIAHHPVSLAIATLLLLASIPAVHWIWNRRARPLLALGLAAALLSAVVHQFLLVACLAVLLLLLRYTTWQELSGREARLLRWTLMAWLVFWVAFGLSTLDHSLGLARGLASLGYQLLRFPNFIGVVVRPWVWAVPHLGAALLLLLAAALYRMGRSNEDLTEERALLVLFVVLLLASSASHPPRQETRYVFNLYPLAIIIGLTTIARASERANMRPATGALVTAAVAVGGFALSEDFRPNHLLHVDSPDATFRVGIEPSAQSHLIIRDDFRGIAEWLRQHAPPEALVINGVHGLDRYYSGIRYFYVDEHSPNFPDWACRRGTVERWGNYPMVYSIDALAGLVKQAPVAYLISFAYDDLERLPRQLAPLHPRQVLLKGGVVIFELRG